MTRIIDKLSSTIDAPAPRVLVLRNAMGVPYTIVPRIDCPNCHAVLVDAQPTIRCPCCGWTGARAG